MIDRETVKCECTDGFYGRYCEISNSNFLKHFTFHINLFLLVDVNCISKTRTEIRAVLFFQYQDTLKYLYLLCRFAFHSALRKSPTFDNNREK